jgi:uncharacterized protein (DUF2141 family)
MQRILPLLLIVFLSFNLKAPDKSNLRIKVEGIKKVEGNLGLLLFNQPSGFPDQASEAVIEKEVKVTATEMIIEISDLPFGRYAIALIHDENSNQEFDRNLVGIPKEPFGFSKNKSILKGLPDFHEAAIEVKHTRCETTIRLINLW